jgi:ATP-dependent DNA helicase RecG
MHLRTFNTSWDAYPDQQHALNSISMDKVSDFIKRVNQARENPINGKPMAALNKYELVKEGRPTHAAFLLFMKGESALTAIELGRFQTETIIKDTARAKTDLISEVDIAVAFVKKHINKNVIITGEPQHEERWEYPIDAIREIVINAVIHRDYRCSSDTVIKVFDNKIEFYNPGGLPPGYSVRTLLSGNYVSAPRNKKIADMFKEADIIEKYGSGIKRIIDAFKKAGLRQPVFEEIGEGFRVTVSLDKVASGGKNAPVNAPVKLSIIQDKIFSMIHQDKTVTIDEMAGKTGKDRSTIRRNVTALKKIGILGRIGSDKKGVWIITQNA